MGSGEGQLEWDMDMIMFIQEIHQQGGWNFVECVISHHPLQDISTVTWLFFIWNVVEFGFPFLWIIVGNYIVVKTCNYTCQTKRPIDVLKSIRTFHTDPDTMGFPSLETHLAIVVLYPTFEHSSSSLLQGCILMYIVFLGFTRIYAGVRFPSQIAYSWITGTVGILLGYHGHMKLQEYTWPRNVHLFLFIF